MLAQSYYTTIYTIAFANSGVDLNNLHIGKVIYICSGYKYYYPSFNLPTTKISKTKIDLNNHLRMLWK